MPRLSSPRRPSLGGEAAAPSGLGLLDLVDLLVGQLHHAEIVVGLAAGRRGAHLLKAAPILPELQPRLLRLGQRLLLLGGERLPQLVVLGVQRGVLPLELLRGTGRPLGILHCAEIHAVHALLVLRRRLRLRLRAGDAQAQRRKDKSAGDQFDVLHGGALGGE